MNKCLLLKCTVSSIFFSVLLHSASGMDNLKDLTDESELSTKIENNTDITNNTKIENNTDIENNTEGNRFNESAYSHEKGEGVELSREEVEALHELINLLKEKALDVERIKHADKIYQSINDLIKENGLDDECYIDTSLAFEYWYTGNQEQVLKLHDLAQEEAKKYPFHGIKNFQRSNASSHWFKRTTFPIEFLEIYQGMATKEDNVDGLFYTASMYRKLYAHREKKVIFLDKAIEIYEVLHKKGHTQSTHNLGVMNWKGSGMEPSLEKACVLFLEAAKKGSDASLSALELLYEENKNFLGDRSCFDFMLDSKNISSYALSEKDEDNLFVWKQSIDLTESTRVASIDERILRKILSNPSAVNFEDYTASELFGASMFFRETNRSKLFWVFIEEAVRKGSVKALHSAAVEMLKLNESLQSKKKAIGYLKRAAEKGHKGALDELVAAFKGYPSTLLKTLGLTADEIISCFKVTADQGDVYAIRRLLEIAPYSRKYKNMEMGMCYFEKLFQLNDHQAMLCIGEYYISQKNHTLPQLEKALSLFEKAGTLCKEQSDLKRVTNGIKKAKLAIEGLSKKHAQDIQKLMNEKKNSQLIKQSWQKYLKPYLVQIEPYEKTLKTLTSWKIDTQSIVKIENLIKDFKNLKGIQSLMGMRKNFQTIQEQFDLVRKDKLLLSFLLRLESDNKSINQCLIEIRPLLKEAYADLFNYQLWKDRCNGYSSEMDTLASDLYELAVALDRFDKILQEDYLSYDAFDHLVKAFKSARENFKLKASPLYKELRQEQRTQHENSISFGEKDESPKIHIKEEKDKKEEDKKQNLVLSHQDSKQPEKELTDTSGLCSLELIEALEQIEEKHKLEKKELFLDLVKKSHSMTDLLNKSTDGLYIHTLIQSAPINCVWLSVALNGKNHKNRLVMLFDTKANNLVVSSRGYGNYHKN